MKPLDRSPWLKSSSVLLACLLLGGWFFAPTTHVLEATLDSSNYGSYARFAAEGRQFGTEVVPMAGPLSFVVYGWVYSGDLYWTRFGLELATKLVFAALVLGLFYRMRASALRWVWLAAHVFVVPATSELGYDLSILYAGLLLVLAKPAWLQVSTLTGLLAYLALLKGTQLFFTLAVVAVVVAHTLFRRGWRGALAQAAVFVVALSICWIASGQHLVNLPHFFRGLYELSSGYHAAMGLAEAPLTFATGLATLVLLAGHLAWFALSHRRDPTALAAAALLGGFAFLQWKHGFVRADGHVYLFFHYAIVGALTAALLAATLDPRWSRSIIRIPWMLATLAVAMLATGDGAWLRWVHQGAFLADHAVANLAQLTHPSRRQADLAQALQLSRDRYALPAISSAVGAHSIDFFGYDLGYLLLNGLNYRPRPVGGGSFGVFTSQLRQLNEDFLRDDHRRPDFFLLNLQTIDQRLPAQDDAGTLLSLLDDYRPVLGERRMLLLQAARRPSAPPDLRPLRQQTLKLGEEIAVPAVTSSELLLATFKLKPTLAGRIRAFLYKPAVVSIEFKEDNSGAAVARRIIPSMVSRPVIISPQLETTRDVLALYTTGSGRPQSQFRVVAEPAWAFDRADHQVSFYAQPRPAPLSPAVAAELDDQLKSLVASRPPDHIDSPHAQLQEVAGRMVQIIEPPSQMVFDLKGDERELRFDYGIAPEAYQRGTTDGVDFIVDLQVPGAPPEQLFLSRRDPRNVIGDRGRHHAQLWLPLLNPDSQIVLRTASGPHGDAQWDWSYFDNIRLRRGPPELGQFPGFSRAPVSASGSTPRVVQYEHHDVLLLNAPSLLNFELTGSERSLLFSVGYIPGAYLDGNTDGADFVVELHRSGQSSQELHRLGLHPKSVLADRQQHELRVDLPATAPGTLLSIRVDPGPRGDLSWDWTYIANVHFE